LNGIPLIDGVFNVIQLGLVYVMVRFYDGDLFLACVICSVVGVMFVGGFNRGINIPLIWWTSTNADGKPTQPYAIFPYRTKEERQKLGGIRWYHLIGGMLGVFYSVPMLMFLPLLGYVVVLMAMNLGGISMGLVIDKYVRHKSIVASEVVAVAVACCGVVAVALSDDKAR